MTRAVKARRKRQTPEQQERTAKAGKRRIANRKASSRYYQRESFENRCIRLLGADPELASITLKANPKLAERLIAELESTPAKQTGGYGVTYPAHVTSRVPVLDKDGLEVKRSDGAPWLSEVIQHGADRLVKLDTLEREDRQAHADHSADINAAVESGDWSQMMLAAGEGLRETRLQTRRKRDPDVPSAEQLVQQYGL